MTTVLIWCRASLCAAALFGLSGAHGEDPLDLAPTKPPRVLATAFFGTHFHGLVPTSARAATAWPDGQIGSLRLWDSQARWADLEPASGRFEFDRLDAYVEQARDRGANVLLVLGSAARWSSARPNEPGPYGPGSAAEPARMDDWDRYVTAVVRRYKGRITQYELWNEPYFSDLPADRGHASAFFTGSVATMVELARRTRAVLDREDPRAVLLTPGFVGGVQRFEMFLAAGGARYVGGVSYHFYADEEREFLALYRDVRAVMARRGIAALPLYNTESGFAVNEPELDRRTAAAMLARTMMVGAFAGLDRFYQYAWDNGRMGMLLDDGHTTTPSLPAFVAVRRWLIGTALQRCRPIEQQLLRCEGERDGLHLWIVWRLSAPGSVRLRLRDDLAVQTVENAIDGPVDLQRLGPDGRDLVIDGVPLAIWWRERPPLSR